MFNPGEKVFRKVEVDKTCVTDPRLPVRELRKLHIKNFPLFEIKLKEFAPIMILRNIDPRDGLCNGTQAVVVQIWQNVILVELDKKEKNNRPIQAFIPRYNLIARDDDGIAQFNRKQFPISLSFAMTINKVCIKNMNL